MDTGLWTASVFAASIVPQADRELDRWRTHASRISSPVLREQALASITHKRFHVLGGSVYALYPKTMGRKYRHRILSAIAAIQTISDYLDNLCDRAEVCDEDGFRQLHVAMSDALDPDIQISDNPLRSEQNPPGQTSARYYRGYPCAEDDGYLAELVRACRLNLSALPGYSSVRSEAMKLVKLYCDLQSLKHLDPHARRQRLEDWAQKEMETMSLYETSSSGNCLEWWEFAAATGSTLGLFMLFAMAAEGNASSDVVDRVMRAYFPWICGLHILLDYLIDLEEDEVHGDFNFVACYSDSESRRHRLALFVREAVSRANRLPQPEFHLAVVRGLLALYLSDPKVRATGLDGEAKAMCAEAGWQTRLMRMSCQGLRRLGMFQ